VNPAEALAETDRASPGSAASAPEAVGWLHHPEPAAQPLTLAQRLAAEPPWSGPDRDSDEDENHNM
jgi:hypothetical protein